MANSPSPSVANMYGPYLDVRSFGAVGDGLTDDTSAIQACIDAAADTIALDSRVPGYSWITELQGGIVFFPRGWYKISSTLTLGNRVSLVGSSRTACGIVADSSMTDTSTIMASGILSNSARADYHDSKKTRKKVRPRIQYR